MRKHIYLGWMALLLINPLLTAAASDPSVIQTQAKLALNSMLQNIKKNYAYAAQKNINWSCLNSHYKQNISGLKNKADAVLFFERLLLEFADSHMTLNTNTNDSYRLNSPLLVRKMDTSEKFVIDDIWHNQLTDTSGLNIGAELISINGASTTEVIEHFPTHCLDKSQLKNQQWIINKALAGQYSKPRVVTWNTSGNQHTVDLDKLEYLESKRLLESQIKGDFGVIKINNSLGQTQLINMFDQAIDQFNSTGGLVLDLRNTIAGGDSYIARAIIGRFIQQDQAYQQHRFEEHRNGGPKVTRLWTEYVTPRGTTYMKPMVVLVNGWTGSMGEGLTIGLHGMQRAHVMGSPMAGLLGAVYGFPLEGMGFGYQIPAEKLFHVNGMPRELFEPDTLIKPSKVDRDGDQILAAALQWLKNNNIKNQQ